MDMNFWNNRFIFADSDGSVNFTQSILQTQATALESRVDLEAKFAKPRGLVVPKGITGSRFNTQTRVTAANFSTFFSIS